MTMLTDGQRIALLPKVMQKGKEPVTQVCLTQGDALSYSERIESAACVDRDARIAELEQRNRDLYEDVQRFKEHALNEKAARLELERQLEEARKDAERWNMTVEIGKDVLRHPNNRKSPESVAAYMAAINKGYDMTNAIDEAIDAAMKGQQ